MQDASARPQIALPKRIVPSSSISPTIEPERRKFKPHVTLARFRSGAPDRLGGYFQRHSRLASEPFLVDRFALFRSHLGSEGAHYEVLAEYLLKLSAASESPLEGGAPVPVPGS